MSFGFIEGFCFGFFLAAGLFYIFDIIDGEKVSSKISFFFKKKKKGKSVKFEEDE